jgi:hypothetical protein
VTSQPGRRFHIVAKVLDISAWGTAVMVLIGGIASVEPIATAVTQAQPGSLLDVVGTLLLTVATLLVLTLWLSAMWYAAIDPRTHPVPRALILVALFFLNIAGALAYYFFFVFWVSRTDQQHHTR